MDPKTRKQRLDAVPMPIRARMGAEENLEIIRAIKDKFKIPADNPLTAQLLFRLMIEDLPPQYFAWELKNKLNIAPEAAKQMAEEVRKKVLDPLKTEFKKISIDISLVGLLEEPPASVVPMPKAPVPLPDTPSSQKPTMPIPPAKTAPPIDLSSIKRPEVPRPDRPAAIPLKPAAPAPFMMHQESAATPLAAGEDFRLDISSDIFGPSSQIKKADVPRPPKAAKLELGKVPRPAAKPSPAAFRAASGGAGRVVHYTDLRTMVSPGISAVPARIPPAPVRPEVPRPDRPAAIPLKPVAQKPPPLPPPPKPSAMPGVPPSAATLIHPAPPAPPSPPPGPASSAPPVPSGPAKAPKVVNYGSEEVK